MKTYPNDYLKYWRVIRYYTLSKHNLKQAELETLLFLYSEVYFNKQKFLEFNNITNWDSKRFSFLLKNNWIERFRNATKKRGAMYRLTDKSRRVIFDVYRKLNGEEIPTSLSSNPMFLKNVSYSDKVYRNMVIEMNTYVKKNRLLKKEENQRTTTTSLSDIIVY